MQAQDLFSGSNAVVYSSTCTLITLLLMFIVSIRLFLTRRKKAYFSLSFSLLLIMMQYIVQIVLQFSDEPHHTASYLVRVLNAVSFILINLGIYQLFNPTGRREKTVFSFLVVLIAPIAGSYMFFTLRAVEVTEQLLRFHAIWIELYLFLLIFLCYYLVHPFIGQSSKYMFAVTIYFFIQLSEVINRYMLDKPSTGLIFIDRFLPIVYYIIIFMIIFNRVVELLQAIYQSSIKDGLTGVYNRRYFYHRVQQFIQSGHNVSAIFFDIDNFKKLNDTQGHQKGDEVLKQVASILQRETEDLGVVGRYGGEELVVLLYGDDNASKFAEHLRSCVQKESIVTVSVGFCTLKKGMGPTELIKRADEAMYVSKKTGKNKVTSAEMLA